MNNCSTCRKTFEPEMKINGKYYKTCLNCRLVNKEYKNNHEEYFKTYRMIYKSEEFKKREKKEDDERIKIEKENKLRYQQKNKDLISERNRIYRETNVDSVKEYQKAYRDKKRTEAIVKDLIGDIIDDIINDKSEFDEFCQFLKVCVRI